jgi:hypothetical protein
MIFVLQPRGFFRSFQDQFLGDLAQFSDDFLKGTVVRDGLFHFFGLSGRQSAEGVSQQFLTPSCFNPLEAAVTTPSEILTAPCFP